VDERGRQQSGVPSLRGTRWQAYIVGEVPCICDSFDDAAEAMAEHLGKRRRRKPRVVLPDDDGALPPADPLGVVRGLLESFDETNPLVTREHLVQELQRIRRLVLR
jgi:hypothetical protein